MTSAAILLISPGAVGTKSVMSRFELSAAFNVLILSCNTPLYAWASPFSNTTPPGLHSAIHLSASFHTRPAISPVRSIMLSIRYGFPVRVSARLTSFTRKSPSIFLPSRISFINNPFSSFMTRYYMSPLLSSRAKGSRGIASGYHDRLATHYSENQQP